MHIPVLQKEVLQYLEPKPNENFIDATIGQGGHTLAILEKNGPKGKVLGIELDTELYQKLKKECLKWSFKQRLILVNDSYANLREIVEREKFGPAQGVLFDLGMSSWHLTEAGRGFSFLKNEVLDMRYNSQNPLTAEKIVNYWSAPEIERILNEYGEEQFAQQIARDIIGFRQIKPIKTTFQLVELVRSATPGWYHRKKRHPATKTFQALRIAVNDEFNNLQKALPQALEILKPGGRLVVISFHSLEDRIVKNFYRSRSAIDLGLLTKKPIRPTKEEIINNPRSRSARLRAAVKIICQTTQP